MQLYDYLIAKPIFNALMAIYSAIPGDDFGITIIIFTVFIRFLLYPLLKRQLHQTRKMRMLQPELKKIKQRANGDRQAEAMQMMELYKKHGVSPFRSIGLLLIQLPIFIGLFHAIQKFASQRNTLGENTYEWLKQFEPVRQLIENPESFNQTMLGFIDLTKHGISAEGINITLVLLALFSAITQYISSKQTMPRDETQKGFRAILRDAAAGKQADQTEINTAVAGNMIRIMPIMMFAIMVSLPGAIALYYTTSNLIAVIQQAYLLRQDEEELEEIADEPLPKKTAKNTAASKKSAAKSSRKASSKQSTRVTRIVAKDSPGKRAKAKRRKS